MNSKIVLSFLAGFALAAGAAFVLCRKKCRKKPPHNDGSKPVDSKPTEPTPPAPNPTETKPGKPIVGAQNPFGEPNPIHIDPTQSVEQPIRPDGFTYRDLFFA